MDDLISSLIKSGSNEDINKYRDEIYSILDKDLPVIKLFSPYYIYALDKRGQLWGWGMGLYVFSQDEKFKQATPRLIVQDENAVKVIGGGGGAYSYGILKKTGEVELWFAGKLLREGVQISVSPPFRFL